MNVSEQTKKAEKWSCTLDGKNSVSGLLKPSKLIAWAKKNCRSGPTQTECRLKSVLQVIAPKASFTCDEVDGKKEQWTCITEDGRTKQSALARKFLSGFYCMNKVYESHSE